MRTGPFFAMDDCLALCPRNASRPYPAAAERASKAQYALRQISMRYEARSASVFPLP